MAKVTSKFQITLPKRLAEQYGIAPGDEVEFIASGDSIRLLPAGISRQACLSLEERLRLFDQATERQQERNRNSATPKPSARRDWTRDELYTRG